MAIVAFSYAEWAVSYPNEAAYTSEQVAETYFEIATSMLSNGEGSRVPYDPTATPPVNTRKNALYLAVAHIAQLNSPARAGGGAAMVGAISKATEGSVSVETSSEFAQKAGWWGQTQWGLLYWKMLAPFRTFQYVAARNDRFRQPRPYRP